MRLPVGLGVLTGDAVGFRVGLGVEGGRPAAVIEKAGGRWTSTAVKSEFIAHAKEDKAHARAGTASNKCTCQ